MPPFTEGLLIKFFLLETGGKNLQRGWHHNNRGSEKEMKAYLWKTGIEIRPFQDPVGDSLIVNKPLRDHQKEILSSCNIQVEEIDDPTRIEDPEFLLIKDNLYFSPVALKNFLKEVRTRGTSGACALEKGPYTEFTDFIQDLRTETDPETKKDLVVYGLYFIKGRLADSKDLDQLPPFRIKAEQKAFPVEPGEVMPASVDVRFTPGFTDAALMHVCHWVHLWLVNIMALGITLKETFLRSKIRLALRALSAFSFTKHKIASRFVVKVKKCDIHPTAVVQGCILGDEVKIGPYAIVQGSIIGNKVSIPEQAIIVGSVMGDRTSTCNRGVQRLCVLYPGSSGGKNQGCLFGRDVFIADFSFFIDIKLKGTIRVYHEGRFQDTGMNFLGSCVGHESIMSPGTWIDTGREIPNRSIVMQDPGHIISKIPPELGPGELLVSRNGVLTRLKELLE